MVGEVFAGLGAFKTMFDLAKGLKDINDAAVRNAAVIELQEQILAAQAQQAALVENVDALEKEVADLKAWDADKKRYQLTDIGNGRNVFAYVVKESEGSGEPAHKICANCYADGHKSFLQAESRYPGGYSVFACHRCGNVLWPSGGPSEPQGPTPRVQRGGTWGRR